MWAILAVLKVGIFAIEREKLRSPSSVECMFYGSSAHYPIPRNGSQAAAINGFVYGCGRYPMHRREERGHD